MCIKSEKSTAKLKRTDYITRLKEAYQRHSALEKSKVSGEPDEHHAPDKETEIQMATFDQFIASLRQEFGEQGAGKKFEVFCKWFLENDPEWSKKIYYRDI